MEPMDSFNEVRISYAILLHKQMVVVKHAQSSTPNQELTQDLDIEEKRLDIQHSELLNSLVQVDDFPVEDTISFVYPCPFERQSNGVLNCSVLQVTSQLEITLNPWIGKEQKFIALYFMGRWLWEKNKTNKHNRKISQEHNSIFRDVR